MNFGKLIEIVGDEPLFESSLLLAGDTRPADVRKQLSRWTKAGRLYQLRRGLYTLAPPNQKAKAHPFLIANRLMRSSYVSGLSALAHYGLIPEHVPVVNSVTTLRPARWDTPLGRYEFRHVKLELFFGYKKLELGGGQEAFVATPEKALLDLIYLQTGGDSPNYVHELRLQNLERLNEDELQRQADQANSPKLQRAAVVIRKLMQAESIEYEMA
jgi:predicted transcriptional regulator of viral defense system